MQQIIGTNFISSDKYKYKLNIKTNIFSLSNLNQSNYYITGAKEKNSINCIQDAVFIVDYNDGGYLASSGSDLSRTLEKAIIINNKGSILNIIQ